MTNELPLAQKPITVLLVDDQAIVGAAVKRMLADQPDIVFHFCSDPSQAEEKAVAVEPTVILQDLVMPDVDGLTLVKRYRENPRLREVPLIVLSTREEPETKAEAFALGANDYLVKLPDKLEVIARLRYHSKGYIALLQRNEAMAQLMAELAEAERYVKSLLPEPVAEGPVTIDWRYLTCTSLGGDAFGYRWLDPDHLAVFVLDVCGHGVGAALLSVSALNVLRSEVLPGADFLEPSSVLAALNEAFPMTRQNNAYFTIWYGVYDRVARTLTHASGGHPAALLMATPHLHVPAERLRASNLIIGFLPGFKFKSAVTPVPPGSRLYVFSDGCYEVEDAAGAVWPFDDFADYMSRPPAPGASKMDELLAKVREIGRSEALPDDFSIIELSFA